MLTSSVLTETYTVHYREPSEGNLCILETGNGEMQREDTEMETCLWGALQIKKDLKFMILGIFKTAS